MNANENQPKPDGSVMQHFSGPPPGQFPGGGGGGGIPPFGMPPPGFPGAFPPGPWNGPMGPWSNMPMMNSNINMENKDMSQSVTASKPGEIDPLVISKAAEWTEHRAPDGRPYYYHSGRGESIWEKPQAIKDLEAARMAAFASTAPPAAHAPTPTQIALANSAQANIANCSVQGNVPPNSTMNQGGVVFDPLGFVIKSSNGDDNESNKNDKKKKQETEKKKKEDEEEDKSKTPTKVQDKSRPISSTPISGTPWCVVWTGDGRVFFYNPSTRTSVWVRPEELLGRADVDKAISTPPEQLNQINQEEKKVEENNVTQTLKRTDSESSEGSDEIPSKKPKIEPTGTDQL